MTERNAFAKCRWINPPERWLLDGERLLVVTGNGTDFWRETHYGFVRDTGHLFGCDTGGDFTIQVRVRANYAALYDQAGIMVRLDERNWVKAGIEKFDGECQLSSVLTVDRSNRATGAYGGDPHRRFLDRGVHRLPPGRLRRLLRRFSYRKLCRSIGCSQPRARRLGGRYHRQPVSYTRHRVPALRTIVLLRP